MPALAADPTIRRQVMAAARDLLEADAAAPVARIATAAGVSRATFYRHFGSRAELLASVERAPRPPSRTRILEAAEEMLLRTSLAQLSMDELARAAGVSRGTLYRIFPGKPALMRGLVEAYSPFEMIRAIATEHGEDPPEVFFPLVARAIVGVAGRHLGILRAIFQEITGGSEEIIAGVRPIFVATIGQLAAYAERQMIAGRLRPMHPLLALQVFIGPIYFHLMTRPILDEMVGLPMDAPAAVDDVVAAVLEGLVP
jgi:AcrR family transcriptional regulator